MRTIVQRRRKGAVLLAGVTCLLLGVLGCAAQGTSSPSSQGETLHPGPAIASPHPSDPTGGVTIVAAGDIASTEQDARSTADLVASLHPDEVLPLGDNAYEEGSLTSYDRKYDPTWGAFKAITEPVPGNHEYRTSGAAGYFQYFRAQPATQSYYAWNLGAWRMYALNCEIDCRKGSAQEQWLQQDLAAHPGTPALAYVHRPRFTCSTKHAPDTDLVGIWGDLQASDGRLMLAGHNHSYERFGLLDAEGRPNPDGLRQFVVGTGGAQLYPLESVCPNREAQNDTTKGVLELTLKPTSYAWKFIGVDGKVRDAGSQSLA